MHSQEQACQKGSFWMVSELPVKRNQGVNSFDAQIEVLVDFRNIINKFSGDWWNNAY